MKLGFGGDGPLRGLSPPAWGAWIETWDRGARGPGSRVAPRVGGVD